MPFNEEEEQEGILEITDDYIDINVGPSEWFNENGNHILEQDYRVNGEVWRVHKSDADPYPSKPHAHCIAGAKRFIGCTLHLGTGILYEKRTSLNRRLDRDQFERLIKLIQPKFPDIKLPLPD